MRILILFVLTLFFFGEYSFSQCNTDYLEFENREGPFKGKIDTIHVKSYTISVDGKEKLYSEVFYSPILNSKVSSNIKIDYSYGKSRYKTVIKFDEMKRVVSSETSKLEEWNELLASKTEFFYGKNGCDSLIVDYSYDYYSMDGDDKVYQTKIFIEGLKRTEIRVEGERVLNKEIFLYNKKGQLIENLHYIYRDGKDTTGVPPNLIKSYEYDKNGNPYKVFNKNSNNEIGEVVVHKFDKFNKMIDERIQEINPNSNPLSVADEMLKSVGEFSSGISREYLYDEQGNVTEIKWSYKGSEGLSYRASYRYVFKK